MVLFYHPLATWADLCLIKAEEVEGMGEVALERPSGKAAFSLHSHVPMDLKLVDSSSLK